MNSVHRGPEVAWQRSFKIRTQKLSTETLLKLSVVAVLMHLNLSFLKNPRLCAFETKEQLICRSRLSVFPRLLLYKKMWSFRSQQGAWAYFDDVFIRGFALNWFRDVCHSTVLLNGDHFDGHCHSFSCENCGVHNFCILCTKQSTALLRNGWKHFQRPSISSSAGLVLKRDALVLRS